MHIEVVFALPERQELVSLELEAGATVADAIAHSAIASLFPEHDLGRLPVGIWGRIVECNQPLEDGDRVEIYRPLAIDPREQRRALAAQGKSMGAADDARGTGNPDSGPNAGARPAGDRSSRSSGARSPAGRTPTGPATVPDPCRSR